MVLVGRREQPRDQRPTLYSFPLQKLPAPAAVGSAPATPLDPQQQQVQQGQQGQQGQHQAAQGPYYVDNKPHYAEARFMAVEVSPRTGDSPRHPDTPRQPPSQEQPASAASRQRVGSQNGEVSSQHGALRSSALPSLPL